MKAPPPLWLRWVSWRVVSRGYSALTVGPITGCGAGGFGVL